MKEKEKAIELVNKFKEYADEEYHECSLQYDLNKARENNAKQCALIAVHELLKVAPIDKYENLQSELSVKDVGVWLFEEYWIEVKKEIELL